MFIKLHILFIFIFLTSFFKAQELDSLIVNEEKKLNSINFDTDPQNYFKQALNTINFYNQNGFYLKSELLLDRLDVLKYSSTTLNEITLELAKAKTYKVGRKNDLALEKYLIVIKLLKNTNYHQLLVTVYCEVAEFFRSIGNFNYARNYIIKAQFLFDKYALKNNFIQCRIYHRYAAILHENSPSDSVLIYTKLNLNLANKINHYDALGVSYNELGLYYKNHKNFDSSSFYYTKAKTIFHKNKQFYDAAYAFYNYCQLNSHNTLHHKKTIELYKELLQFISINKIPFSKTRIYSDMMDKYFFIGDSLNWYRYMSYFLLENNKDNAKTNQIKLSNQLAKYEKEKALIEKTKTENKLKKLNIIFNEEKQRTTTITIIASLFLLLITIICFLYFKNYKKNKKLQDQNKVKDALIQEIHHRVKNNLQFVNSIINMQISSDDDKTLTGPLNDAARRISSMALVHEMLYNQNDTEGINIKIYIEELVLLINDAVNSTKLPIKFKINCDALIFNTTKTTAIGMIITELISNSIKHAFKNVNYPLVEIKLNAINDNVTLEVKDNGNGIQETTISKNGIGTRLIDIFSRQLKGEYITNSSDMGYTYNLKFKK